MKEFKALNELDLKISNQEKTLVEESCCTAITIALNNNGDVFTSFVGAYNPDIIKLLKKVQKTYFKGLVKKLKNKNEEAVKNVTKQADVQNEITTQTEQPKKVKKVHEPRKTKQTKEENKTDQSKQTNKTKNTNKTEN